MSRIVKLTAQDFKRLVAVEIEPDGNVVMVTGANGHGKTSVLDAITAALVGQQAFKLDKPIREGAEEAMVELDMGEFVVTRRWKADKSSLEVRLANGANVSSPRRFLDDMIGKLSFDPLEFASADAKTQRITLLDVAGLASQEAVIAGRRQRAYDRRTAANRRVKELAAQLAGLPKPVAGVPTERVDAFSAAEELNQLLTMRGEFDQLRGEAERVDSEMRELEARLADLRTRRTTITQRGRELMARQRADLARIDELKNLASQAVAINENALRVERIEDVERQLSLAKDEARQQDQAVDQADAERVALLASADLPIQGLGVDDEGVTLNGVPFSQASAAERMRTSIAIAMRLNPDVRVIRVADASLLDSVNRALIEQMADEQGYQIWLEVVDETKSVGFVIEDGRSA